MPTDATKGVSTDNSERASTIDADELQLVIARAGSGSDSCGNWACCDFTFGNVIFLVADWMATGILACCDVVSNLPGLPGVDQAAGLFGCTHTQRGLRVYR